MREKNTLTVSMNEIQTCALQCWREEKKKKGGGKKKKDKCMLVHCHDRESLMCNTNWKNAEKIEKYDEN